MAGASFILAINLFVAGLFALAFFLVGVSNRSDRVAPFFALAYVFGIVYIVSEFVLPLQMHQQLAYTIGFASFLGALGSVAIGVARRYGGRLSPLALALFAVLSIASNWLGYQMPHDTIPRNLIFQLPYAIMQGVAAWVVISTGRRQPVDVGLIVLFILSALQFASKPFAATLLGGSGETSTAYLATTYALYSQSLGAMLQVSTGLLMLTMLVRDMLIEVTARSETDPLSGVFNRRGFDEHATGLDDDGRSTALVLADLDYFKSINDAYGHAAGDQVIVAFARLLRDTAPPNAVVGRLGGEEFAVLLPDANLASARLLAEGLRAGFASLGVPGLPTYVRRTASFGVAERSPGENLSDLRRRADAALYVAKRGGRNKVTEAPDPAADSMPAHPMAGSMILAKSA